jgi:uncharacterized membrane protein
MSGRGLTIAPAVLAIVGLGLLAYESIQALRNVVIGTSGNIVLYVGVGLFVLAAVLVVIDLTTSDETTADDIPMHVVDETQQPSDS